MAYAQWPETLPKFFLVDGFTSVGNQPVYRQQMESGLDRVTKISSSTVRTNTYSIICNNDQLVEFWSFYNNEGNSGADFVLVPMITGNTKQLHRCRFASYPNQIPDGLEWRVTFTLETDEQHLTWS